MREKAIQLFVPTKNLRLSLATPALAIKEDQSPPKASCFGCLHGSKVNKPLNHSRHARFFTNTFWESWVFTVKARWISRKLRLAVYHDTIPIPDSQKIPTQTILEGSSGQIICLHMCDHHPCPCHCLQKTKPTQGLVSWVFGRCAGRILP